MKGFFVHRPLAILLVIGATTLALTVGASGALAEDGDFGQPIDFLHNVNQAPAPVNGTVWAKGPKTATGTAICTTATQTGANVNTDCEGDGPHNETSIAVNPTDPHNIIGGANDYQLGDQPRRARDARRVLSRAHVIVRRRHRPGRSTRSTRTPPTRRPATRRSRSTPPATPTTRRSASGSSGRPTRRTRTSSSPTPATAARPGRAPRSPQGSGNLRRSVGDLLDKEYVAAWGDGNAIVTYGDFRHGQKGAFVSARIYASVTHDGGAHVVDAAA